MLDRSRVHATLPARDLNRARRFYAEKLGLEPRDERPEALRYQCANGEFVIFASAGESVGAFTQMGWEVDDLDATVAELRRLGVSLEDVDLAKMQTNDGILDVGASSESKMGLADRVAWFRDSEGNVLTVWEPHG